MKENLKLREEYKKLQKITTKKSLRNIRLLDDLIINLQSIFVMSDDTISNNDKLSSQVEEIVKDFKEKVYDENEI